VVERSAASVISASAASICSCRNVASPPISSNGVRARIRQGTPVDDLVPSGVALLIEERGLYRNRG